MTLLKENVVVDFMRHAGLSTHTSKIIREMKEADEEVQEEVENPFADKDEDKVKEEGKGCDCKGKKNCKKCKDKKVVEEADDGEDDDALYEELKNLMEAEGFGEEDEEEPGMEFGNDEGGEDIGDEDLDMSDEEVDDSELGLEDDMEGMDDEAGVSSGSPEVESVIKDILEAFAEAVSSIAGIKIDVSQGGEEEMGEEADLGGDEGMEDMGEEEGMEDMGEEPEMGEEEGMEDMGGEEELAPEEEEALQEAINLLKKSMRKKTRKASRLKEQKMSNKALINRVKARIAKRVSKK